MHAERIVLVSTFLVVAAGRAGASPEAPPGTVPQVTDPSVPPPIPTQGAAAPMVTDDEDPPEPIRRVSPTTSQPPSNYGDAQGKPLPLRNPKWGMMLELGLGGGGDDLVTVRLSNGDKQTLSAGDGVAISLGIMVTPLWVGDHLGAGIAGTAGYKGWSVGGSNGDIGLSRFPFIAAVHLLPRVAPRWFVLVRGGI